MTTFTSDLPVAKETTMTTADEMFVSDIKRTLYLIKILSYHIEWFKAGINAEHTLKTVLNNTSNSHKRLLLEMSTLADRKSWEMGMAELNEDYVKDLGILLDELQNVPDLSGIIEAIQKSKTI